jgi:hypothetical protein
MCVYSITRDMGNLLEEEWRLLGCYAVRLL